MRLGFARFVKLFISSLFIQSSWSFFSMQALGFLFSITRSTSPEKRALMLKTHKGFFNTHPYMAGYIIGAAVKAHDLNQDPEEIKRFLTVSQTSFASTGDTLFWQTTRPALLSVAVILGLKIGIAGPLAFIIVYNVIHLYHRAAGLLQGYRKGWDVIYILKTRKITLQQKAFELIGAFAAGFLPVTLASGLETLLVIPLTGLFLILILKRTSALIILTIVLILVIIMILVPI
jgi:PTS system N-acetylgalactosamine-specific IID component